MKNEIKKHTNCCQCILALLFFISLSLPNLGMANSVCEKALNSKTPAFKIPSNRIAISSAQLLDSMAGFSEVLSVQTKHHSGWIQLNARTVTIDSSWPLHAHTKDHTIIDLSLAYRILAIVDQAARQELDLSPASAKTFALVAFREALMGLGLKWSHLRKEFLNRGLTSLPASINAKQIRNATFELEKKVQLSHRFDVSGLAGFSSQSAKNIYIDRDLPTHLAGMDLFRFLLVHEAFEKALMNTAPVWESLYYRTHQIAQRLEKAVVQAFGHSWLTYQYEVMNPEIDKNEEKLFDPQRFPPDHDKVSDVDYAKSAILDALKKLLSQDSPSTSTENFTLHNIGQGVYIALYADQTNMTQTLMRIQEHYESPQFRGKITSRKELQDWFTDSDGRFTYSDWDGFNFPSTALSPFRDGTFKKLSLSEQEFLTAIPHDARYIISVVKNGASDTLLHEVAHALYGIDPTYRNKIVSTLSAVDTQRIQEHLRKTYHETVIPDEVHAWLMHNPLDLEIDSKSNANPIDLSKSHLLIYKLRAFFYTHCKKLLNPSIPINDDYYWPTLEH